MTDAEKLSWSQAEYNALRAEILSLSEASRRTIKVILPLAAALYAAPYALRRLEDVRLWSICTAVSGLLLFTMTQSLFWNADGIRRISTYIKEVIEPQTEGTLLWEAICFELHMRSRWRPSEEFIMAFVPTVASLFAAWGVGVAFLRPGSQLTPLQTAAVPATIAVWHFHRLARTPHWRKQYAGVIESLQVQTVLANSTKLKIRVERTQSSNRPSTGNAKLESKSDPAQPTV